MPKRKSALRKKAKEKTTLQKQKQDQTVGQSVRVVVNLAARRRARARKKATGAPVGKALEFLPRLQPPISTGTKPPIVSGNITDETRRAIMAEGVKQANQERAVLLEMERKAKMIEEQKRKETEQATMLPEKKTEAFKKELVIPNPFKKARAPYGSLKKAREEADAKKKLALAEALKDREEEFRIQTLQQNIPKGQGFRFRGDTYYPPPGPPPPSESIATTTLYTPPRTPPRVARSDTTSIFY
jgi:hypothetical protein